MKVAKTNLLSQIEIYEKQEGAQSSSETDNEKQYSKQTLNEPAVADSVIANERMTASNETLPRKQEL